MKEELGARESVEVQRAEDVSLDPRQKQTRRCNAAGFYTSSSSFTPTTLVKVALDSEHVARRDVTSADPPSTCPARCQHLLVDHVLSPAAT